MYVLDGNYRFLIYWSDNPLSVSSFNYDKLNDMEIQALTVLDVFQVIKVKDLLYMADDPKQISKFLGNAYTCFLSLFDNLVIFSL